jgi:hypothetical protein
MGLAMAAKIEYLCFAPLSAGIFCGMQRRAQVVSVGMHVVAQFSYSGLKEVHFVGYGREQRVELCGILRATPCPPLATARDPESEDAEAMMLRVRCAIMGLRSPATGTDAAAWQGTDWAAPGEMFDKLLERLSWRKPSHWIVAATRRLDQAEVPDASEVAL